tara:strand:- start:9351 stop:10040 length:690 start_codon:yes stop_codon:yes gene_type:complete
MTNEHIVKAFSDDLLNIKNSILEMGGEVEKQLHNSIESLVNNDSSSCEEIIAKDNSIDELQIRIQADVEKMIALKHPIANDLRNVLSAMQIARDLERVGDLAKNIAKRVIISSKYAKIESLNMEEYGALAKSLLHDALDAFVEEDKGKAMKVWREDYKLDVKYTQLFEKLIEEMDNDPSIIIPGSQISFALKNIERIGDHATNIAEDVIFNLTGERPKEEREKSQYEGN